MSVVSGGGGYGEKTYWDQRYANEDKYEWYLSYAQFKGQLLPHLHVADYPTPAADDSGRPRSSVRLLVVGCGNSELSKQLFDDGFTDLHSVDYSEVVIDKMVHTYRDTPELKFGVMDVRSLTFPSSSFDCVLDKGTLDAILCGSDSSKHAGSMLSECQRVLRPGGCLLVITYGQPSSRLTYLEQRAYDWEVTYETLGGTRYMYTCVKRQAADEHGSNGGSHSEQNGQPVSVETTTDEQSGDKNGER